jgi:hypothetical protein
MAGDLAVQDCAHIQLAMPLAVLLLLLSRPVRQLLRGGGHLGAELVAQVAVPEGSGFTSVPAMVPLGRTAAVALGPAPQTPANGRGFRIGVSLSHPVTSVKA